MPSADPALFVNVNGLSTQIIHSDVGPDPYRQIKKGDERRFRDGWLIDRVTPTLARRALESGRAAGLLICADSIGTSKRDARAW